MISRLNFQFPLEHFQLDVPLFSQTPHVYIMYHICNSGLALHGVRMNLVLGPNIEGFHYPLSDCTLSPKARNLQNHHYIVISEMPYFSQGQVKLLTN